MDILNEKIEGLVKKAEKSGMPYGILKKVYDRGMAAWKTGHRPGTTPQQWAFARVNSFVTKSSGTWGKADKDLADKVRGAKKEEIENPKNAKDILGQIREARYKIGFEKGEVDMVISDRPGELALIVQDELDSERIRAKVKSTGDEFTLEFNTSIPQRKMIKILDDKFGYTAFAESKELVKEKLPKDADAGDYVKDFRKSKAPQFKGKSDKKIQKMAIAAYLDSKEEVEVKEGTWELPKTSKQKAGLKHAMKIPIKLGKEGQNARNVIGPFIGDDVLFDDLMDAGDKNPRGDARPIIKKAMKRLGIKEEVKEENCPKCDNDPCKCENIQESGHTDVASMKTQVQIAMDALQKMQMNLGKLTDEDDLPTWWTNKVATAVNKLDGMADYIDAMHDRGKEMSEQVNLEEDICDGNIRLSEGRMKELHGYIQRGMSAREIAKKMKLDVKTIEALMKEEVELDEETVFVVRFEKEGMRFAVPFRDMKMAKDGEKILKKSAGVSGLSITKDVLKPGVKLSAEGKIVAESKMGELFLDMQMDAQEMSERDFIKTYSKQGFQSAELKRMHKEFNEEVVKEALASENGGPQIMFFYDVGPQPFSDDQKKAQKLIVKVIKKQFRNLPNKLGVPYGRGTTADLPVPNINGNFYAGSIDLQGSIETHRAFQNALKKEMPNIKLYIDPKLSNTKLSHFQKYKLPIKPIAYKAITSGPKKNKFISEKLDEEVDNSLMAQATRVISQTSIREKIDPADIDVKATAADRKAADKNIIIQLRRAQDMEKQTGRADQSGIEFLDKKKQKVDPKIINKALDMFDKMKPNDKAKMQSTIGKSYRDLLKTVQRGRI